MIQEKARKILENLSRKATDKEDATNASLFTPSVVHSKRRDILLLRPWNKLRQKIEGLAHAKRVLRERTVDHVNQIAQEIYEHSSPDTTVQDQRTPKFKPPEHIHAAAKPDERKKDKLNNIQAKGRSVAIGNTFPAKLEINVNCGARGDKPGFRKNIRLKNGVELPLQGHGTLTIPNNKTEFKFTSSTDDESNIQKKWRFKGVYGQGELQRESQIDPNDQSNKIRTPTQSAIRVKSPSINFDDMSPRSTFPDLSRIPSHDFPSLSAPKPLVIPPPMSPASSPRSRLQASKLSASMSDLKQTSADGLKAAASVEAIARGDSGTQIRSDGSVLDAMKQVESSVNIPQQAEYGDLNEIYKATREEIRRTNYGDMTSEEFCAEVHALVAVDTVVEGDQIFQKLAHIENRRLAVSRDRDRQRQLKIEARKILAKSTADPVKTKFIREFRTFRHLLSSTGPFQELKLDKLKEASNQSDLPPDRPSLSDSALSSASTDSAPYIRERPTNLTRSRFSTKDETSDASPIKLPSRIKIVSESVNEKSLPQHTKSKGERPRGKHAKRNVSGESDNESCATWNRSSSRTSSRTNSSVYAPPLLKFRDTSTTHQAPPRRPLKSQDYWLAGDLSVEPAPSVDAEHRRLYGTKFINHYLEKDR